MLRKLLTHSRYRLLTVLILIAATNGGIALMNARGWLMPMEMLAYDLLLSGKTLDAPTETRVCLVEITEEDIRQLGHWPPTDTELADLFQAILRQGPRVIGLDLYRDVAVPPGTERLRQLFAEHGAIINIFKMDDGGAKEGGSGSGAGNATPRGFSDLPVDRDGMVRRGLLFMDDGTTSVTSFAMRLATHYLADEGIVPEPAPGNPDLLKLGQAVLVPLNKSDGGYVNLDSGGYQLLLDYGRKGFPATTFSEVVAGRSEQDLLRDKIVIIGVAAESVKDNFFLPIRRSLLSSGTNHGIEIHAHLASQLLRLARGESMVPRFVGDGYEYLWMLFWGLLAGMAAVMARTILGFAVISGEGLLLWCVATFVSFRLGLWLPVMPGLLSYLLCCGIAMTFMTFGERSDNKTIMQIFSRHVSHDVAQMIMLHKDKILDGGRPISRKLTATVLFVDIKGFSRVAEGLEPQQLMEWLNAYLGEMTAVIISHQGVVNKYIGDAIMAIFGVPFARDSEAEIARDAFNAVACALAMGAAVEAMNLTNTSRAAPRVQVRIGVNTGLLVAGCVGNDQRMEYTVLGDAVNIASRLESMQRDLSPQAGDRDWRLYVSEATWQLVRDRFAGEHVGRMELKGKSRRVDVYDVLGTIGKEGV
jgi:adenylate cyclase